MTKKTDFPRCENPQFFMKMIRQLFSSRRKTVRNNLLPLVGPEKADSALEKCGISASERAENLSLDSLLKLSDAFS